MTINGSCPQRVLVVSVMAWFAAGAALAGESQPPGAEAPWAEPMSAVRARFTGRPGTFAQFGDSITVSMAFWAGLPHLQAAASPDTARLLEQVRGYLLPECWREWKGADYGSEGSMTIRWAQENVGAWLKRLNPEVAHIMFGTNDLEQLELEEYERKTREVVERCLENGSIVILSTIPPRSGRLEKARAFAAAVRRVAKEKQVPLIDYFAEVLRRRPDDWDGSLPAFKEVEGDEYQVPTLISRDGVHPSNPKEHGQLNDEALAKNGYLLRSYLTLLAYGDVVLRVLEPRRSVEEAALRQSALLHASFDEELKADRGGEVHLSTRFAHETRQGEHVFEKGVDSRVFRAAQGKGIHNGALECTNVLPRNGRIFFPARGNIGYRQDGWSGAVSVWINTDLEHLFKTQFCDPVQITHKGASNGAIWFDFNDAKPRDMRFGAFTALAEGEKAVPESDPNAPMVRLKSPAFKAGDWHHVVISWKGLDSGRADAEVDCYLDGKRVGGLQGRAIAMKWDLEKTGIYVAVNFVGLLDELVILSRPASAADVAWLHRRPGLMKK